MKLINRDTDYTIQALCAIARHKEKRVSVAELVRGLEVPRPFLRKTLQILNRKGLLKSYRGQGGGFSLARPPQRIFLSDLIRIFQGPVTLKECLLKKKVCPNVKGCALRQELNGIERYVVARFNCITIASLF